MFRRRREKKTDYRQRLALLKSGTARLVVRRSLNNIHVQLIEYHKKGDKTVLEESSKSLRRYGWKGHCGNLPAAYLTGFLAGFRAMKNNIPSAVLNTGLQLSVKGNAVYAAVSGARDAGMKIPAGKEILPGSDRISGRHVADYASKLKKESNEKYKKQFSGYLKNELQPENIEKHFEEVKKKIISENQIDAKHIDAKGVSQRGIKQSGGTAKEINGKEDDSEDEWEDVNEESIEVGEEE